jgi:hypothetical protein
MCLASEGKFVFHQLRQVQKLFLDNAGPQLSRGHARTFFISYHVKEVGGKEEEKKGEQTRTHREFPSSGFHFERVTTSWNEFYTTKGVFLMHLIRSKSCLKMFKLYCYLT